MARLESRVMGVCGGVLCAVFGAFAAGFAEDANAQDSGVGVMTAPQGQVYALPGNLSFATGNPVDGNQSLADFFDDVPLAFTEGLAARHFGLLDSSNNIDQATQATSGLPIFSSVSRNPIAGDRIALQMDYTANPFVPFITVRIYTKGGADLFMAAGEDPQTIAAAGADEFYIIDDGAANEWTTVGTITPDVIGFRAVVCDTARGYESTDMLTCNFEPSIANCALDGRGFDADANMCVVCGMNETADDNGMCQMPDDTQMPDPNPTLTPPQTTMTATTAMTTAPPENGGGGDDETKDLRNILGGVGVVMFFATWAFSDDLDNYEFSPSFGYSVNENGYSANAGGRLDFRKGDWSAYWSAGQTNANGNFGEFRYSSGGEYKTDFWKASFSESVQGKTADYDLSLSADLSGGMWSLSPVYRIHSRLQEGESATRNSLNLEGVLEYERWTIRQSAGFGWRRAEEFGDNARFRLEAVREF